jgi:hypothetical protein
MNRRTFITQPLTFIVHHKQKTKNILPVTTRLQSNEEYIFQSNNEKFVSFIMFEDYDDTVLVNTYFDWEDPISDTRLNKIKKELFMIEKKLI